MARLSGVAVTTVSVAEIQALDGVTAGIVTASKAVVAGSTKNVDELVATVGFRNVPVARTATDDGLTTAIIAAGTSYVTVTSADAAHFIVLPAPVVGHEVVLMNGATGYELQTSTPASIAINAGTGTAASSSIGAAELVTCRCTSATTWVCVSQAADGTVAAVDAAAAP
jgi:hypothetical protein